MVGSLPGLISGANFWFQGGYFFGPPPKLRLVKPLKDTTTTQKPSCSNFSRLIGPYGAISFHVAGFNEICWFFPRHCRRENKTLPALGSSLEHLWDHEKGAAKNGLKTEGLRSVDENPAIKRYCRVRNHKFLEKSCPFTPWKQHQANDTNKRLHWDVIIHRTSSGLCGTRTRVERTSSINWLAPNTSIKQQHYHLYRLHNKHHSIHTKNYLHTIKKKNTSHNFPMIFTGVPLLNPTVFFWRETLVASPFFVQLINPGSPNSRIFSMVRGSGRSTWRGSRRKFHVEPTGRSEEKSMGFWGYGWNNGLKDRNDAFAYM